MLAHFHISCYLSVTVGAVTDTRSRFRFADRIQDWVWRPDKERFWARYLFGLLLYIVNCVVASCDMR